MKKFLLTFISALVLFFAFSSCVQPGNVEVYTSEDVYQVVRAINASIENYNSHVVYSETGSSTRSILPETWTIDGKNASFWLYGKSTNGQVYQLSKISPNSKGEFNLNLNPGNWILTLFAIYNTFTPTDYDSAMANASLYAIASADMTAYTSSVLFRLSSRGLSGKGNLDVGIKLDGWKMSDIASTYSASICLTNPATGEIIKYSSGSSTLVSGISSALLSDSVRYHFGVGNDTLTKVSCGYYNILIQFTNSSSGLTSTWSDLIYIEPGTRTAAEINIPRIVEKLPDAPSDFKICYDSSSVDFVYGTYGAYFTWTDNSNNEDYFEIELLDINSPPSFQKFFTNHIVEDPEYYIGGSLLANSKELVMRLPLGKSYRARIRSVNSSGYSDWCECQIATVLPVALKVSVVPKLLKNMNGNTADIINLHRILYNVNGGVWYSDWNGSSGTSESRSNIVEYYGICSSDISVSYSGYDEFGFKRDTSQLICWYLDGIVSSANQKIPGTAYNDSEKNMTLYANYDDSSAMTEAKLNLIEPKNSWVDINNTVLTNEINSYSAGTSFHLGVTVPASVGVDLVNPLFKFDSIKVSIKNPLTGSTRSYEISGVDVASLGSRTPFSCEVPSAGNYELDITFTYSGYTKRLPTINLTCS